MDGCDGGRSLSDNPLTVKDAKKIAEGARRCPTLRWLTYRVVKDKKDATDKKAEVAKEVTSANTVNSGNVVSDLGTHHASGPRKANVVRRFNTVRARHAGTRIRAAWARQPRCARGSGSGLRPSTSATCNGESPSRACRGRTPATTRTVFWPISSRP